MTFNFESEVEIDFDFDHIKLFESVGMTALEQQNCPYEVSVWLTIVDDESIREINKETRNIDKATDVLSFPMNEYINPGDFSHIEDDLQAFEPDTGELILGDIVLSIDHIKTQAFEYGHSIEREYAFLICHSMLHLMGYDHMEEDERIIMENNQNIIMNKLIAEYPQLKVD